MRIYRLFFMVVIVFCLGLAYVSPALAVRPFAGPQDPKEVAAFLDGLMRAEMSQGHVAGAVVVIVKDGQVFHAEGYGYADLEKRLPVDPAATLFRPGSVSKLFTWTAVMQLVEQGKLDLNADVNQYLDFNIPATYPEPITLKVLMTHTPGFEDMSRDLFKLDVTHLMTLDAYLKSHLPTRVFAPGKVGAYSNYGTALAGYIVERVSGEPFAEYIEKHIFEPLGMQDHSTFRQPVPEKMAGDLSHGYNFSNGKYVEGSFEFVNPSPAGSLSASGLSMAQFMLAHLQNGRLGDAQILQEATAIEMHRQLYTPDSRIPGMAHGFFENEINGQRVISHGGDTLLFHSGLFLFPELNFGVFISTNSVGGSSLSEKVIHAFMDRYYPATASDSLTPSADFDTRASQYTGTYILARSNFTGFEKLISMFSQINVTADENKDVLISLGPQQIRFVEIEPGLLVARKIPGQAPLMEKLVLKVENDQVSLHPSMPFVFLKVGWQDSLPLHLLILLGGGLVFLISIVGWVKSFFVALFKRESRPWLARLVRVVGGLFGLVYLIFLVGLIATFADILPAYGVPRLFFETPAGFDGLLSLVWVIAVLALVMVPLMLVTWVKGFWTLGERFHYTVLSLFALAIVWSLYHWNFL